MPTARENLASGVEFYLDNMLSEADLFGLAKTALLAADNHLGSLEGQLFMALIDHQGKPSIIADVLRHYGPRIGAVLP